MEHTREIVRFYIKQIMENTKFLYGKSINFKSFLKTGSPLWFRDLNSLGKLENQQINDDESIRNHEVNFDQLQKITLNERDFKLAKNSTFNWKLPTRRCHVLCLSNCGNDDRLFQRFNADICIELRTDKIIELIKEGNRSKNLEVVGRDVEYYLKDSLPSSYDPFELVFKKEYKRYHIENEYRIAIFWPEDDDSTVFTTDNRRINVFGQQASNGDHIKIKFNHSDLKDIVVNTVEL